jgi:mannose-1-phosphate guanylyltransferase
VIMAGGAGTRFWPASRALTPKQLLPLGADASEPLLAAAVRRIAPVVPPERVYIATGAHLADATARVVPEVPRANILAEPVPRNTAPCIAWANATIARHDPDAVVAVLPSDHFMTDEPAFVKVLARAMETATRGPITTIGVVPTRPETGYGYIEVGEDLSPGVRRAVRFVEKPDRARAEEYVASARFLWNAGMFFFRATLMKDAVATHLPDLARGVTELDAAAAKGEEALALARIFPTLPSVSIDVGVMEKAAELAVVPGDFGWNDVGSWASAWELAPKDDAGNALPPGAVAVAARNNLVRDLRKNQSGKRVYALMGVDDLVVVETDDAVLVIPRERAQDVREIVDALKTRGDKHLL